MDVLNYLDFQDFGNDRQSRRSEWEDRRRGEVFGHGREWGDRHDMRRDMSHEEHFDSRRDDHRFDDRNFRRDDERQLGRDGRPMSRGNDRRSVERNIRDPWREDIRDERMGMRDERMRDNRMDDRRRDRHSPSPYDKRGYRDDRFSHEDRMFGRDDRELDERMRDERGMMDRGRDDRMRDDRGLGDREMRGMMDRGRDDRGPLDRERGMMERGRDDRGMDRGRDDRGGMDRGRDMSVERGRGNRGRDDRGREDRMGMERGREDRLRDERSSLERGEERGFMEDKRRDRSGRDDRRPAREDRGYREEEEDRIRERGGKFERDFRDDRSIKDDRRREEFIDRASRESSPADDRTPDHRSREEKFEKEEPEKISRDGSPKEEKPRKPEKSKEKSVRDDRSSEKSSKDSRTSRDEKSSKEERRKDDKKKKEDKSERKRKDDRSPRREKEDRSPKREGRRDEKEQCTPRAEDVPNSDVESTENGKQTETQSKESRKRSYEKEEIPLSPIPKRLREVSPASSSRSRGSHSSRNRSRDQERSRPRHRGDSGSDKDDHTKIGSTEHDKMGSTDRDKMGSTERDKMSSKELDKKSKKKDDSSKKSEKGRSLSPRPSKDRSDDKADKERSKVRRRSRSASSSRSKEHIQDNKENTLVPPKKSDENLYDEDNISAIVSLGGKSSAAEDDKASDHQSLRSVPFSDWSEDDMADNILNQAVEVEKDDRQKRSPSRSSMGSRGSARDRKSHDHVTDTAKEGVKPEAGSVAPGETDDPTVDKDRGFDDDLEALPEYEQISSDEDGFMEDETENKPQQSIVNILDIDWSSLKETTTTKPKGSALQRFTPANIFTQLGVSRAYAGDELFEKIKSVCQKQLDEKAKEENADEGEEPKKAEKFVLHDSVAAFHCSALRKLKERANLLKNIGSHRRALCARKDLEIRRKLCKVNKVFDQSPVYPSHVMDTDLSKLSIQLFRQGRDHTPDKKEGDLDLESKADLKCST